MPLSPSNEPSDDVDQALAQGDFAARAGDWTRAIALWERTLDGDQEAIATHRIRWFLDETSSTSANASAQPGTRWRGSALLLMGVGSGFIGTAFVLLAEGHSGQLGKLLATGAWLMYVVAAVLAVSYAFRSGQSGDKKMRPLSVEDVRRAREQAASFDASGAEQHHSA